MGLSQVELLHARLSTFSLQTQFFLPESYLPVISVRICKNLPARTGPEAGHRPASGLCGSPNLRGLAVKDQSVSYPRVRAYCWGVALGCVSKAPG